MSDGFPRVVSATAPGTSQLADLWCTRRDEKDTQLLQHGELVFKGFRIDTAGEFGAVMASLSLELGNYVDGNSPRTKLTDAIYTSTEYPAELPISLYNELLHSDAWPARLYFCVTAALQLLSKTVSQ
jgi:Taurine catabolism dioxygenase TauD, TfdA family